MMKFQRAVLPLAAILCAATTASAAPQAQDIVITGSARGAALADWSTRVEDDLSDRMRSSNRLSHAFKEGIVTVGFHCTEAGRPDGVAVIRSSGNAALDRMAVRAVHRLTSLHPMATGMRHDQKVAAEMLYINAYGTNRKLKLRLKELEAQSLASNRGYTREQVASGEVLLLGAAQ